MTKPISPLAADRGKRVEASIRARCTCNSLKAAQKDFNPTCPVHGHGRPPGVNK